MNRPDSKIKQGSLIAARVQSGFKTQPARDLYKAYGETWQDSKAVLSDATFIDYLYKRMKDIWRLNRKTHELYKFLQDRGDNTRRIDFIFHMMIQDCRVAEKLQDWVLTHMSPEHIKVLHRAIKEIDQRYFLTLLHFDDVLYEIEQIITLSED